MVHTLAPTDVVAWTSPILGSNISKFGTSSVANFGSSPVSEFGCSSVTSPPVENHTVSMPCCFSMSNQSPLIRNFSAAPPSTVDYNSIFSLKNTSSRSSASLAKESCCSELENETNKSVSILVNDCSIDREKEYSSSPLTNFVPAALSAANVHYKKQLSLFGENKNHETIKSNFDMKGSIADPPNDANNSASSVPTQSSVIGLKTNTPLPTSSPTRRALPYPINKESLIALSPFPIHSSYIVREKIGQGTWGSVHLAIERASGLERAVKKIPKRFTSELSRFRQEITFVKSMDHPNIVRLYETFEDYANIYMVMEYCRGGELFDRVAASKYFCEAIAAKLMYQILSAVFYAHRKNLAHRDLKPENFLFVSKDEHSAMKLIDFGLAKRFNGRRKLRTKVGTLYYVSPQVLEGAYTEKCDIWSAGVILYLLLCGTPPFNGPTDASIVTQIRMGQAQFTESIWSKVTPLAKELVQCMLSKDAEIRPSAQEALQHPWFSLFSPSTLTRICLPRPFSMPGNLMHLAAHGAQNTTENGTCNFGQRCLNEDNTPSGITAAFSETGFTRSHLVFPQWKNTDSPVESCCKLSVFGIHSPVCRVTSPISGPPLTYKKPFFNNSIMDHCGTTFGINGFMSPVAVHDLERTDTRLSAASVSLGDLGVGHCIMSNSSSSDCIATMAQPNIDICNNEDACMIHPHTVNTVSDFRVWRNLASRLVPKWKRFAKQNQLKRAALRVIAQQLHDGDTLQPLRSLFIALDSKNDGALTGDEIVSGMRILQNVSNSFNVDQLCGRFSGEKNSNSVQNNTLGGTHIEQSQKPLLYPVETSLILDDSSISCENVVKESLQSDNQDNHIHLNINQCNNADSTTLRDSADFMDPMTNDTSMNCHPTECHPVSLLVKKMSGILTKDSENFIPVHESKNAYNEVSQSDNLIATDASKVTCITPYHAENKPGTAALESVLSNGSYVLSQWNYSNEEVNRLVNEVALDGSDMLEYSDFLAASMDRKHYMLEAVLKAAFRVFDRDGDGHINAAELRATLGWSDPYTMTRGASCPSFYAANCSDEKDAAEHCTIDEELDKIFTACDLDKDGAIGYNDFIRCLGSVDEGDETD